MDLNRIMKFIQPNDELSKLIEMGKQFLGQSKNIAGNFYEQMSPYITYNPTQNLVKNTWSTIQGETPLMRKLQSYQGEAQPISPTEGIALSAMSPLETLTDAIISKDRGGFQGALQRGGDIPGALMSRGMNPDTAMNLGMFAAMVMPGAGELSQMASKKPIMAKSSMLVSHEGAPDQNRVNYYINKIKNGDYIAPIKVVNEGNKYGIEDGKHRFAAYQALGIDDIPIELVKTGTTATQTYTKGAKGYFTGSNSAQQSLYDTGDELRRFIAKPGSPEITPYTGAEKVVKKIGNIEKLQGENGSFRYVYKDSKGNIVSALQGVSGRGRNVLSNIYTTPELRNKGIATELVNQAKKDFPGLEIAETKTDLGKQFFRNKNVAQGGLDEVFKLRNLMKK